MVKQLLRQHLLAVQAAKGSCSDARATADIAKGGTVRDETKTVTIACAHVEYETETVTMLTLTALVTLTLSRT